MKKYNKQLKEMISMEDLDWVIGEAGKFDVDTFLTLIGDLDEDTHIYIESMSKDKNLRVIGARIGSENDLIIEVE